MSSFCSFILPRGIIAIETDNAPSLFSLSTIASDPNNHIDALHAIACLEQLLGGAHGRARQS